MGLSKQNYKRNEIVITERDLKVLIIIKIFSKLNLYELSLISEIDRGNLSNILSKLSKAGLVDYYWVKNEKAEKEIQLTKNGRRLLNELEIF